ncbi:MAG: alpha-amylase [Flavobacteriaceae bacterium]|nr:alpha-amylase [Flavobacteriaceae bacterium]
MLGCNKKTSQETKETSQQMGQDNAPFSWKGANVYFLLTDRFNNGDTSNDVNFGRDKKKAGTLRGFEGGDLKGVTQKIRDGYFDKLGINAIWMTPIVEQIHGATDEGTGLTFGYHGYWTRDWTAIDPNFGTEEDLRDLVETAHAHGIRILLDAVINHTGPVTEEDPVWPDDWVRTGPQCKYQDYESTVSCTLVKNLPDVLTESDEDVELPKALVEKWKNEGRYEQEITELDAYFKRTGHPRAPRFYIMKWLTDYITEFGIDGYRVDTAKHTEETVWQEFRKECDYAFAEWKKTNPEKILDDNAFYMVGEVYGYGISGGQWFDFGDRKVDYFENAFNSLINFEFKWNARQMPIADLFTKYDTILHGSLKNYGVLNYLSSHDDGDPFDALREHPLEAGTLLILAPGTSQVYYGDESARLLKVPDAIGDANLRSNMNWDQIAADKHTDTVLTHWQKLGKFRKAHPAVGAGKHQELSQKPYIFSRTLTDGAFKDAVIVGMNLNETPLEIVVTPVFKDGDILQDAYTGAAYKVENNSIVVKTPVKILLLEKK